MSWFKNVGGLAGSIIGAVIVLPLLLVVYNYFFINKNDSEKYVKPYMDNSREIALTVPDYNKSTIDGDDLYGHKTYTISMQTKNMGRSGSKTTELNYRLVYHKSMKKYFKIMMFDWWRGFWDTIDNENIVAKVNNADLLNKELGLKDNPVLVFSVRSADGKPLKDINMNGDSVSYDVTLEQYKYNVRMYLTYIMPKKDFKERFESQR